MPENHQSIGVGWATQLRPPSTVPRMLKPVLLTAMHPSEDGQLTETMADLRVGWLAPVRPPWGVGRIPPAATKHERLVGQLMSLMPFPCGLGFSQDQVLSPVVIAALTARGAVSAPTNPAKSSTSRASSGSRRPRRPNWNALPLIPRPPQV